MEGCLSRSAVWQEDGGFKKTDYKYNTVHIVAYSSDI